MYVHYAGTTVRVCPPRCEPWDAQIFSAVLGASSYFHAEASRGQDLESWIGSHVRALAFFAGAPETVVPDNLKSRVTGAHLYEPRVNRTYLEFARHYGMSVLPARPERLKDKAKVKSNVKWISQNILEPFRHERFTSLAQLNAAIAERRARLNAQPFRKRPESRRELYESVDLPALQPLPAQACEFARWLRAKVNLDHHVTVDGHHYSAPAALVREHVDVRLSEHSVELLHRGERVAVHLRSHREGGYTTNNDHRPRSHREHLAWPPERIKRWAAREVGPQTGRAVSELLDAQGHPREHYRPCLGVIRLSRHYGADRLEAASQRALQFGKVGCQSIKSIPDSKADRLPLDDGNRREFSLVEHGNVRGGSYYREHGGEQPQGGA